MSKHKFLFKHSSLYNSTKLAAFQSFSSNDEDGEAQKDEVAPGSSTAIPTPGPYSFANLRAISVEGPVYLQNSEDSQIFKPVEVATHHELHPINLVEDASVIQTSAQSSYLHLVRNDYSAVAQQNQLAVLNPVDVGSFQQESDGTNPFDIIPESEYYSSSLNQHVRPGDYEIDPIVPITLPTELIEKALRCCSEASDLEFDQDNLREEVSHVEDGAIDVQGPPISVSLVGLEKDLVPEQPTLGSNNELLTSKDSYESSTEALILATPDVAADNHQSKCHQTPVFAPITEHVPIQKCIPTGVITRAPAASRSEAVHAVIANEELTCTEESVLEDKKRTGPKRKWSMKNIRVIEGDTISYECKVCSKQFKNKNNCKYHQHDEKACPYQCDICGKGMTAKTHFDYHLKKHANSRPHKCSKCPKEFITANDLKRHYVTHNVEKTHKCLSCPRSFFSSNELRRHVETHAGTEKFSCKDCSRKFSILSELKKHEPVHTGFFKFQCSVCVRGFSWKKDLDKHFKIHTGEKPFKCDICQRQFRLLSSLNHHKRNHNRERPFRCPDCNRGFLLQKDCTRHQKSHHGEAPFKCELCEKQFRRNDNLKRHVRLHHNEDLIISSNLSNQV